MTQLSQFYSGWPHYQQSLVSAISPLTLDQLALRGSPDTWSIGIIAAHIIAARVWWFHTRMGEGTTDLAPLEYWDAKDEPLHPAAELVDGLERTWQMIWDALGHWDINDLEHIYPKLPADPTRRSRRDVIWHVMEHDIHHGGELSSLLGTHGLPAVALE